MPTVEELAKDLIQNTRKYLNCLYAKLKRINNNLLDKANNSYEDATFLDVINFAITSNGLSFVKSYFYNCFRSSSCALTMRNILEYYALYVMYEKDEITDVSQHLLTFQGYIDDYLMYSENLKGEKYKNIIDYDELVNNYKHALEAYEKLGYDEKYIKYTNLPFLLTKKNTYKRIVYKYIPEFKKQYDTLCSLIHPHDFNRLIDDDYAFDIYFDIFVILMKLYGSKDFERNECFDYEQNLLFTHYEMPLINPNIEFYNNCLDLINVLDTIRKGSIKAFGDNYFLNNFIIEVNRIILDINTDHMHGLVDSCKMKIKAIIEMFSVYYKILFFDDNEYYRSMLFTYYTDYRDNQINDKNYDFNDAYNMYKKIYPNSKIGVIQFKPKFTENLGFLIDENGNIPKYLNLVSEMLDKFFDDRTINVINENKIVNSEIKEKDLMFIEYIEALKMSHGDGYLYFANTGSFKDSENIIRLTDELLYGFLTFLLTFEKMATNKPNKTMINVLRNNIKKINELMMKKMAIMQIPRIEKNF